MKLLNSYLFKELREETPEDGDIDWGAIALATEGMEESDVDVSEQLEARSDDESAVQPLETDIEESGAGSEVEAKVLPTAEAPAVEPAPIPSEPVVESQTPGSGEAAQPAGAVEPEPVDEELLQPVMPEIPPAVSQDDRQQARERALPQLEKLYALDDETAQLLEISPEQALPKLAANLHLEVTETVINSMMRILPDVISRMQNLGKAKESLDDAFYKRWPALNTQEGRTKVAQFKTAFLNANPKMTRQQYIDEVGVAASVALRVPVMQDTAEVEAPTAPAVEPPPATPAAVGSTGNLNKRAGRASNIFEALDEEIEDFEGFN